MHIKKIEFRYKCLEERTITCAGAYAYICCLVLYSIFQYISINQYRIVIYQKNMIATH